MLVAVNVITGRFVLVSNKGQLILLKKSLLSPDQRTIGFRIKIVCGVIFRWRTINLLMFIAVGAFKAPLFYFSAILFDFKDFSPLTERTKKGVGEVRYAVFYSNPSFIRRARFHPYCRISIIDLLFGRARM